MKKLILAIPLAIVALTVFPSWVSQDGGALKDRARHGVGCRTSNVEPPVVLTVKGPEAPAAGVAIPVTVTIDRKTPDENPMRLICHLPANTRLSGGEADETIVEPSSGIVKREFTVVAEGVPKGDIVFELLQGEGQVRLRAEGSYRFGRPRPLLPVPAKGKPWVMNKRLITVPVQME